MRRALSIVILFTLGGCGGMDSAECVTADWRAIGYEDGAQGRGPNQFGKRRKACAEHGITPNFEAYMSGRDKGLAYFCRPQNGYRLGVRGYRYSGVCPSEREDAFLAAHADGYGLYKRRVAVSRLFKRLRKSKHRADEIEFELVDKTALLVSAGVEITRRAAIGIEIKHLADEKAGLALTIQQLEYDHAAAERDYDEYRKRIADRRGS